MSQDVSLKPIFFFKLYFPQREEEEGGKERDTKVESRIQEMGWGRGGDEW